MSSTRFRAVQQERSRYETMSTDQPKDKEHQSEDQTEDKEQKTKDKKDESRDPKQWRTMTATQRKSLVEEMIVEHARFNELKTMIDYCAQFGAGNEVPTENPPCLVILGAANAGKSKLIEYWLSKAPLVEKVTPEGTVIPYLLVLIPAAPKKKGAAAAFLRALHDPNASKGTEWDMISRIHLLIKRCRVRMIFVDEFQHLNDKELGHILHSIADFLKDIINHTKIPMILVGKLGEAEAILEANDQLERRVGSPQILKPFEWDHHRPETIKEFRTLLQTIDGLLPLDPSGLDTEDMAFRFFYASDGYVGWVMEVIRFAANRAIDTGCNCLNMALLADAYEARVAGTEQGKGKRNPFKDDFMGEKAMGTEPPPKPPASDKPSTRARGKNGRTNRGSTSEKREQ